MDVSPEFEIETALALHDNVEFTDSLMDIICRHRGVLYEEYPPVLRTAVSVNAFSLETNSGGLYQFIANTSPTIVQDTRASLELVGAKQATRVLDRILLAFPGHRSSEDQLKRYEILDKTENISILRQLDEEYRSSKEDVLALLREFVMWHKDEVIAALRA